MLCNGPWVLDTLSSSRITKSPALRCRSLKPASVSFRRARMVVRHSWKHVTWCQGRFSRAGVISFDQCRFCCHAVFFSGIARDPHGHAAQLLTSTAVARAGRCPEGNGPHTPALSFSPCWVKTESIHSRTIPEEIVSAILIRFAILQPSVGMPSFSKPLLACRIIGCTGSPHQLAQHCSQEAAGLVLLRPGQEHHRQQDL